MKIWSQKPPSNGTREVTRRYKQRTRPSMKMARVIKRLDRLCEKQPTTGW